MYKLHAGKGETVGTFHKIFSLVIKQSCFDSFSNMRKKVQVGNDQEMVQSERNPHSTNRGVGKTKMTHRYLYLIVLKNKAFSST